MADNKNQTTVDRAARFANAKNPWLGLGSYNEGQQLYGRDKETADLTDIIVHHMASVVYGKSGIGKSSLLRASVFPQLRKNGFVPIYLRLAHNTDVSYTQQVENAIAEKVAPKDILPDDIPDLGLWDFLHRHQFLDAKGNPVTPVIVLDQFEEIFTLTQVEHKSDVQTFFTELADVLNDVKPDRVIEAETAYNKKMAQPQAAANTKGFVLQSLSSATLKYEKSPSFRIVFSLRDDSLYLLERSSAKIPALKTNRYNLRALDEGSALDVITKPCPDLFTETEAREILDGLAYYEYDDYRVVDPAILSLFLFQYYREKGEASYEDVFQHYYEESILSVRSSTIAYLEEELLTEDGYRKRLPCKQLKARGVSTDEIEHLERCVILKRDKDYIEFSHDLLCKEAQRHRNKRQEEQHSQKVKMLTGLFAVILATVLFIIYLSWPKHQEELVTLNLLVEADTLFSTNEHWGVDFRFLSSSADSVLNLPVQTQKGMAVDRIRAFKDNENDFKVVFLKSLLEKEKMIRVQLFNPTPNCHIDTIDINLQQWRKSKRWKLTVRHIKKIPFVGKIVTKDGLPIEKAMVLLGSQPMQLTEADGVFRFYLEDSLSLKNDLYVFKQGYESEHLLGSLLYVCGQGSETIPLVIPLKDSGSEKSDTLFKKIFAEQRYAATSLFRLARLNEGNVKLERTDSAAIDSILKVYPQYVLNMKQLKRLNQKTGDLSIDVYCVFLVNQNASDMRDAIGNYLQDGKDHLFKGKLLRVYPNDDNMWRLSAIAWDKENQKYEFQGVFTHINSRDKKSFLLEVLKPYTP